MWDSLKFSVGHLRITKAARVMCETCPSEGTLARQARGAKFQRGLPHLQPFGGMCLYGIFWPSLAQSDLGTYLVPKRASNDSKRGQYCHYTPSPPLLPILHE